MAGLTPSFIEIAVPVTAALLYAFIWVASRNLSRAGKILARLVPLGFLVPAMIYFATLSGSRMDVTSQAPPAGSAPQVEAHREEDGRRMAAVEEQRRAAEAAARQRAEAEAQRRAAEEAQAKAERSSRPTAPPPPPPATEPPAATPPPPARSAEAPPTRSATPEPPAPPPGVPAQPEGDWDVVPVFYGTDRVRKERSQAHQPTPPSAPAGSSSVARWSRCPSRTRCPTSSARSPSACPSPTSPSTSRRRTPSSTSPSRS